MLCEIKEEYVFLGHPVDQEVTQFLTKSTARDKVVCRDLLFVASVHTQLTTML